MRPLPAVDPARLGLFTYADAVDAGWTAKTLRRAMHNGALVRHRRGVYGPVRTVAEEPRSAGRDEVQVAAIAAVLGNPEAVVSHTSAALLHGLPLWHVPTRACVSVPPRFVGDVEGVHLHRARTPEAQRIMIGVPATCIARTVIDVGREHGVLSALVVADAALHQNRVTVDALRACLRDCRGWPGVRAARMAIELADPRSESPLETASCRDPRGC